jgi:malate dehydrogenase (oxaloacetate-decarboxylating)
MTIPPEPWDAPAAAEGVVTGAGAVPLVGSDEPQAARRIETAAPAARADGFISINTDMDLVGFNVVSRVVTMNSNPHLSGRVTAGYSNPQTGKNDLADRSASAPTGDHRVARRPIDLRMGATTMVMIRPSAGNALTLRVSLQRVPGTLGKLTSALGAAGALVDTVDIIEQTDDVIVRQIQVETRGNAHGLEVVAAARTVAGVELLTVSDRVFDRHLGGKIEVTPKFPVLTRDDLSMAYTPGVGRVCTAISEKRDLVWDFTIKSNAVAVLTDGTAVLGLGDIGPEAAMPVMEGKAMLFKQLANVDAYPICVATSGVEELVALGKAIAPGFGGINLEDVAAPVCFEVERRLQEELDIPVFHDDQHGTAIVSLAALYGAATVVGKRLEDLNVVFLGMGAAGVACIKLWQHAGVGNFIGVDSKGIVSVDRTDLNEQKRSIAETSNPQGRKGGLEEALVGADVFVGVSGPNLVKPEWVATMAKDAIVFAMANPIPEIMPEEMPDNVAVVATGRSDYANQINNVLVFPGLFRGLLDSRARSVDMSMKVAAARALADIVAQDGASSDFIVPSIFDARVVPAVAKAVQKAAASAGLASVPLAARAALI